MTTNRPSPRPQPAYVDPQQAAFDRFYAPTVIADDPPKRHHIFRWTFAALQVLFLIWVIAGATSGSGHATDCGSLSQTDCDSASHAGTAIGVGILILFWILLDLVILVGRLVVLHSRAKRA